MWFYVLILCISFLSGSLAGEVDCSGSPIPECLPRGRLPFSILETEEDLIESCSKSIEFQECVANYFKRCESDEIPDYELRMRKFMCDRENPIFYAMVNNLKCLKTVAEKYDHGICYDLFRKAGKRIPDNYFQKMYDLYTKGNNTDEEMELIACYNIAAESACGVAQISLNCGNEAKEIAQRALSESSLLQELCKPEDFMIVSEYAKYLEEEVDNLRS